MKSEHDMLKAKVKRNCAFGYVNGGHVKRQGQGVIHGPGSGTSDSVPVDLPSGAKIKASHGEFIVPSDSTAKIGADNLQAMVDATHTPVKPKGRFGRANGGSTLYNQLSDDLIADRGVKGARRTQPIAAFGAPGAPVNVSDNAGQTGINITHPQWPSSFAPVGGGTPGLVTPSTSGAPTIINAGPSVAVPEQSSMSLPQTAVPGITPVPLYGGMDSFKGGHSGLAQQQLTMPIQRVQTSPFGYANGGRVGMANGGYTVEELPIEEIDYSKVRQPGAEPYPPKGAYTVSEAAPQGAAQRVTGPIEPRFTPNPDGTMSPKQMAFENAQMNSARNAILDAATGGAKTTAQKAADGAKGLFGKAKNLLTGAGETAVAKGPGFLKSLGAWTAAPAAIAAAGSKIRDDLTDPTARNARQAQLGVTGPVSSVAADAADVLSRLGDAVTGGYASKVGRSAADWIAGVPSAPAAAAALPNTPSPKLGELSTLNSELAGMNVPQAAQEQGLPSFNNNPELRGQVMRASRPDTDFHNLGDYNAPGTQIYGRASEAGGKINDFAGVGGGQPAPNNGVTFGLKPGDLEAYRAGAQGSGLGAQFGMRAPEHYASPEATNLNNTAAMMANRLANMRPGEPGRKRLTAQLAAVNETASRLQSADQAVNAHNMSAFGHSASMQQHLLSMNNNLSIAGGRLGIEKAQMDANWRIKQAELANQKKEFEYQHGKDAIGRNEKTVDNYVASLFPNDKDAQAQYGGMLKVMAGAKTFDRGGKKLSLHELDSHDLADTLGSITQQAAIALKQHSNHQPMNVQTGQPTRPATLGESLWQGTRDLNPAAALWRHFRWGDVATDDGNTVVPNFELGSAPYYKAQ